jgi:hypothetical protein
LAVDRQPTPHLKRRERVVIISVINHSNGQVKDEEVQRVIRADNRQIHEDFEP